MARSLRHRSPRRAPRAHALGWRGAAGGAGAGPRPRAGGAAARRAVLLARPADARGADRRSRAHPAGGSHDDGARDARPQRGHGARRSRRRDHERPPAPGRWRGAGVQGPRVGGDRALRRRRDHPRLSGGRLRGRSLGTRCRRAADPGGGGRRPGEWVRLCLRAEDVTLFSGAPKPAASSAFNRRLRRPRAAAGAPGATCASSSTAGSRSSPSSRDAPSTRWGLPDGATVTAHFKSTAPHLLRHG